MKNLQILIFTLMMLPFEMIFATGSPHQPVTQPMPILQLQGYNNYSPPVKNLITKALSLAQQHLTYLYGSADPTNKGMDCSGVIYYLLKKLNINDPPREASTLYLWALKEGDMHHLTSDHYNSHEFSNLKPGDLLFWTGTYKIHRYPSITHVSIYLGKNKNGQPLIFSSNNEGSYQGKKMSGVSIYDFKLPTKSSAIKLVGYSCIPTLICS